MMMMMIHQNSHQFTFARLEFVVYATEEMPYIHFYFVIESEMTDDTDD
jgi:hypothetical protein